jgi:hypothetical protein
MYQKCIAVRSFKPAAEDLLVLRGIIPRPKILFSLEMDHDDPGILPVAFEYEGIAINRDVGTIEFLEYSVARVKVLFIGNLIGNFDIGDKAAPHASSLHWQ